jgi:hypothetical protein
VGISPPKLNIECDTLDNGGVVQTGGGDAGDMRAEVAEVVAEVRGEECEIGRERVFSPPKPNIECDTLGIGWGWLKSTEVM